MCAYIKSGLHKLHPGLHSPSASQKGAVKHELPTNGYHAYERAHDVNQVRRWLMVLRDCVQQLFMPACLALTDPHECHDDTAFWRTNMALFISALLKTALRSDLSISKPKKNTDSTVRFRVVLV